MGEEPEGTAPIADVPEEGRRDFLTKAAAAAGAIAAAGMVSALLAAEAEAAPVAPAAVGQKIALREVPLQYQKLRNGHVIEIKSTELTDILAREGLIAGNLKGKQSLMRLEVRYSP